MDILKYTPNLSKQKFCYTVIFAVLALIISQQIKPITVFAPTTLPTSKQSTVKEIKQEKILGIEESLHGSQEKSAESKPVKATKEQLEAKKERDENARIIYLLSMTKLDIEREPIINKKKNSFVLKKKLKSSDIVVVNPVYNAEGKQIIKNRQEAMCLDIRNKSNWTAEDFYSVLNKEMHPLVPLAIQLENNIGINSIYLIAVGASETEWGKKMAAKNNFFNWTNNGIKHFGFDSIEKLTTFSENAYKKNYTREDFYSKKLGFVPKHITPEVVNVKYAINTDGGTNWNWSNVVCEIMAKLSVSLEKK